MSDFLGARRLGMNFVSHTRFFFFGAARVHARASHGVGSCRFEAEKVCAEVCALLLLLHHTLSS